MGVKRVPAMAEIFGGGWCGDGYGGVGGVMHKRHDFLTGFTGCYRIEKPSDRSFSILFCLVDPSASRFLFWAINPVFALKIQPLRAKIDQQTNLNAGRGEVIDELHLVGRNQRLHSLVFNHYRPLDQHIRRKVTNHNFVISHLNELFTFDVQSHLLELMRQRPLVYRLQKPGPKVRCTFIAQPIIFSVSPACSIIFNQMFFDRKNQICRIKISKRKIQFSNLRILLILSKTPGLLI